MLRAWKCLYLVYFVAYLVCCCSAVPSLELLPPQYPPRLIVRTVYHVTGGPEALVQLAVAARELGVSVYRVTKIPDVYRSRYPVINDVPYLPEYQQRLREEDVLIVPNVMPCNASSIAAGATVFMWVLGDRILYNTSCKFFGHSYYTNKFAHASHRSLIRPYMNPLIPSRSINDVMSHKRNTIAIDDNFQECVPVLKSLKSIIPDLEIVVLQHMTQISVYDTFLRSKIVIAGPMMGAERAVYEGALHFAVPLTRRDRNGAFQVDVPFGDKNQFSSMKELQERVVYVLQNWLLCAQDISYGVNEIRRLPHVMKTSLQAMLSTQYNIVLPVCQASTRWSLLSAAAWSLLNPLAKVTIVSSSINSSVSSTFSVALQETHLISSVRWLSDNSICKQYQNKKFRDKYMKLYRDNNVVVEGSLMPTSEQIFISRHRSTYETPLYVGSQSLLTTYYAHEGSFAVEEDSELFLMSKLSYMCSMAAFRHIAAAVLLPAAAICQASQSPDLKYVVGEHNNKLMRSYTPYPLPPRLL